MTIAGGQVVIHADNPDRVTAPKLTFQGSVNAAGEVSASTPSGPLIGTVRDTRVSFRNLLEGACCYTIRMIRQ
jgi:hypothetical protein